MANRSLKQKIASGGRGRSSRLSIPGQAQRGGPAAWIVPDRGDSPAAQAGQVVDRGASGQHVVDRHVVDGHVHGMLAEQHQRHPRGQFGEILGV
jgi:hypothetical protein